MSTGINLLPYRASARRCQRRRWSVQVLVLASVVAGLGLGTASWLQQQTDEHAVRHQQLERRLRTAQRHQQSVQHSQAVVEALQSHHQSLWQLHAERHRVLQVWNEIAQHWPEGVYVQQLEFQAGQWSLQGRAQSSERVGVLMQSLEERSRWLGRPQLQELAAAERRLRGAALASEWLHFRLRFAVPGTPRPASPAPEAKGA